ncbi:YbaB/EbfC family nucleoid-associated protein [Carnobacteriaceae bacterium zg-C25]|nr:YbaB/EbfC family nucleoid-associated protein [Carnobacteriaceae bacterium zg-C25]
MMRGMPNMQGMMKQMQKLQKEMANAQEYVNNLEFVGTSPNDLVQVKMNGKRDVLDVVLHPDVVDPEDVDMLQDLLVEAFNDASQKATEKNNEVMGKYTKNLPF